MKTAKELFERRKKRLRVKLRNNGNDYPRLSVFRSEKNISAQIIDDKNGTTLVSASSLERNLRTSKYANVKLATDVGKLIGERAVEKGVKVVIFDRGGYAYHGKVEALANGAREAGLKF